MTELLEKWIRQAKRNILRYLQNHERCARRELEGYVFNQLNLRETKHGIRHETKPIHVLAFVRAHKELEIEGKINIERPGLPFPVTDFESIFAIKKG
ncbi:MAG: hypothetical protein KKC55_15395 [Gammaproteobacteria bacterium]|nr:hypothetical protein [Gammaproteobacteria bacterium]